MPIYDFLCRDCEHRYDDLVAASDVDTQSCPECASSDVVKLYSPFAAMSNSTAGATPVPVGCGGGACLPGPASAGRSGGCCGGGCGGCG
jgi:putative FmdB family regulatory protein